MLKNKRADLIDKGGSDWVRICPDAQITSLESIPALQERGAQYEQHESNDSHSSDKIAKMRRLKPLA